MSDTVPPPKVATPDNDRLTIKELMAAFLTFGIGIVSLFILFRTFSYLDTEKFDAAIFNQKKDIMAVALGLLGTATGYYLGRVPAEKQADASRREANAATASAAQAVQNKQQVKSAVADALSRAQDSDLAGGGAPDRSIEILRDLERSIRPL
ncbi:hypothetical protein FF100_07920 [Methylobacterium terricola]|uniref:Uncharacterized protein n=1 Tax=Methylobacterium terricola TaxID=2583531 RepID=A0A5C4LIG8_9HYPH|nr:hypothetical protein [Methylobacterium terricola]TNC14104.1 hypothetical protein FF100_07920 [Methylobacterium terricola]